MAKNRLTPAMQELMVKATRLSQSAPMTAIAAELGVSVPFVYACINRGWFPVSRALQIHKAFDVPVSGLVKEGIRDLVKAASAE